MNAAQPVQRRRTRSTPPTFRRTPKQPATAQSREWTQPKTAYAINIPVAAAGSRLFWVQPVDSELIDRVRPSARIDQFVVRLRLNPENGSKRFALTQPIRRAQHHDVDNEANRVQDIVGDLERVPGLLRVISAPLSENWRAHGHHQKSDQRPPPGPSHNPSPSTQQIPPRPRGLRSGQQSHRRAV